MARRYAAKAGITALIAGVLLLMGAAPASAATRVVHPGQSIQAAVDAAAPGDTIVVLPGTYHEAVLVTKDGIKLRGVDAVIKPPASAPTGDCGYVPRAQVGICLLGEVDVNTGHVGDRIRNVKVSGFRVVGFSALGIGLFAGKDVDIVDNTAIDNTEYGVARFFSTGGTLRGNRASGSDEAGLYLGDSPNAQASIVDNVAYKNGLGIFVRDSSHGRVVGNRSHDNCVGILVLATGPEADDWTVKDNVVRDNTKVCAASDEAPPLAGIGILLVSASHIRVVENRVTGNRTSANTFVEGGIVVVTPPDLPTAANPHDNLIKDNKLRNNDPDLFWDGTGARNRFVDNDCRTSIPNGLCSRHDDKSALTSSIA
jgi:parallel beta-helix repeat protein